MKLYSILVICLISVVTRTTVASPRKVPEAACEDMLAKGPGHQFALPQTTKIPYKFKFDDNSIKNTESLKFTIYPKDDDKEFKGFMIQVRDNDSENPKRPIGTFWPVDGNSQSISCTDSYDTGSHISPDFKKSVTMTWVPPADFHGKVTFYVTVAENKFVFWSHHIAGVVQVKNSDK